MTNDLQYLGKGLLTLMLTCHGDYVHFPILYSKGKEAPKGKYHFSMFYNIGQFTKPPGHVWQPFAWDSAS